MARPYNDQKSIRKLSMVGKKTYAVSVPLETINELNWKKGDVLIVRRKGQLLVIEKKGEQPCAE
jgi:bifunctional DNA-binding transcriptional regulator/antitoxin component of YhaV-PrlF toxin-antitoxin module